MEALNAYDGGIVLISHDVSLLSACTTDLAVVRDGSLTMWRGSLEEYVDSVRCDIQAAP